MTSRMVRWLLGQVSIYDNAQHWADADIQISTKNIVRPHAYVGGITSDDKSHVIRVGRQWDGNRGDQGPWDEPSGFRTLAHEFGHYALHLYDEYFRYTFDENNNLIGEKPASCIMSHKLLPEDDAASASAMYYHYKTTELSARDVYDLWSDLCTATAQYQLNRNPDTGEGESAWETLNRIYADLVSPPRWQFTTPLTRGSVLTGPVRIPADVLPFPVIEIHNGGPSDPPRKLTVYGPQGPYPGALVSLYTNQGGYPVAIDQGFTDEQGQIDVYGAQAGDTLRAASFDGALNGSVSVTDAITHTLVMAPPAGLRGLVVPGLNPHLILRPGSNGDTLYLGLYGLRSGGTLVALVTQTGGPASQSTALSYSNALGGYVGSVTFHAPHAPRGTGTVQVIGAGVGSQGISFNSTYALQAVPRDRVTDLYSADGNLHVHLITGTLSVNAYTVLSPLSAPPTTPPKGWQIVGNVYDIKPSGALDEASRPFVLKLHYDPEILKGNLIAPETLRIHYWEPDRARWVPLTSSRLETDQSVSSTTDRFGIYALMGSRVATAVYLPLIMVSN